MVKCWTLLSRSSRFSLMQIGVLLALFGVMEDVEGSLNRYMLRLQHDASSTTNGLVCMYFGASTQPAHFISFTPSNVDRIQWLREGSAVGWEPGVVIAGSKTWGERER